jgi:hypothetical protein
MLGNGHPFDKQHDDQQHLIQLFYEVDSSTIINDSRLLRLETIPIHQLPDEDYLMVLGPRTYSPV